MCNLIRMHAIGHSASLADELARIEPLKRATWRHYERHARHAVFDAGAPNRLSATLTPGRSRDKVLVDGHIADLDAADNITDGFGSMITAIDDLHDDDDDDDEDDLREMCSVRDRRGPDTNVAIACPHRFLQHGTVMERLEHDLLSADHAHREWLTEVPLVTDNDESIGRIDHVCVGVDAHGEISEILAVEFQAVYATGSTRKAFPARQCRDLMPCGEAA